jgi:hypothetical protein
LSINEPLEGWESLDTESFGEFLLFSGINFSDVKWWIVCGQLSSSLNVFWGQSFAMSTPWGIEVNKEELVFSELFIEVFISEYEDSILLFDFISED